MNLGTLSCSLFFVGALSGADFAFADSSTGFVSASATADEEIRDISCAQKDAIAPLTATIRGQMKILGAATNGRRRASGTLNVELFRRGYKVYSRQMNVNGYYYFVEERRDEYQLSAFTDGQRMQVTANFRDNQPGHQHSSDVIFKNKAYAMQCEQ